MASCPGANKKKKAKCLALLYRCKKCAGVGCDQVNSDDCTNQSFHRGKCMKCGAVAQKQLL